MATPPGGGGEVPQAGYYPDPSIPGYIRYWNGGAWVPGTSRPAPKEGEALPAPPVAVAPQLAPSPAPAPSLPAVPAVEETGPVFFDEDPAPAAAAPQEPASAWQATTDRQTGFGGERDQKVSWGGTPDPRAAWPAPDPAAAPADGSGTATPERPVSAEASSGGVSGGGASGSVTAATDAAANRAAALPAQSPAPAEPSSATGAPAPVQANAAPAAPAWPAAGGQAEAPAAVPGRQPVGPAGPGGSARLGGMPVNPAPAAASWSPQAPAAPVPAQPQPVPVQTPVQTPAPAPVPPQPAPAPAPGLAPSPASQDVAQPVLPWKPVAEDPFLSAARAQASARPAGMGRRLLARLVDTLVLGAAVGGVSYPFVSAALTHINDKIEAAKQSGVTVQVWLIDSTTSVQFGIALAAFLVLGVLYEALPTARWGRTLGKKLCGIEVRDIEAHEPPTFGAALRRWLVYSVLGLLAVGVVNVLWCLVDRPWRQCWHDKAARTFVAR
ncbi:RDD family protein [Streptomyces sp. NPDC012769]|uniref:RDD family protein n=1 Tax=Streptomyces sp. NPDC012769 TaxID=3364848 RepID=UPI0036AC6663